MSNLSDPEEFPIQPYTVQLYLHPFKRIAHLTDEEYAPIPVASGVLVQSYGRFFLITCQHVFAGILPEDIVILTSAGFAVRIPDTITFITDKTDKIDLAIVELKGHRLQALKSRYAFLSRTNIASNHIWNEDLFYLLFGFIYHRTRLQDYIFDVESFAFLTTFRHYKKFNQMGFSDEYNIALEYSRRKQSSFQDERRLLGPKDLRGLSGGGIWLSVAGKKRNTYRYLLVGIMTEQWLNRGFVAGTKSDLILEYIS